MKVLHITNNYPTTKHPIFGIFVKEQIDSLSKLGIENEIFFINGREFGRGAYWNSIKELRDKLKNANYDLLHCHHSFSAVILFLTLRFYSFKKIISYQNPPEKEGGIWLFKLVNFFFDIIIVKNISKSVSNSNKVQYLPNGVNTEFFKPQNIEKSLIDLKLDANKKYILFMDSYKRRTQKRIDRFNEVISILLANDNPYNIEPLVLTNTDRSLIPYYMSVSALHLLTSDFEGSPNSVKECMACNTPVVSTPVGNVQDLIGDVDGCYISQTFGSEELADLVIKSLTNKHFVGRQKLLEKKLDSKSVASNLFNIYKSIYYGNNRK